MPVSLRIDYKVLLLTFKCIYGLAPTYLSDLISIKSKSLYNPRSTGKLLLDHPKAGGVRTTIAMHCGIKIFKMAAKVEKFRRLYALLFNRYSSFLRSFF